MSDDRELLRQYAEHDSEAAFAMLVSRHLRLVYWAALRQVGGDEQLAKDVAQAVFTDLARKARSLSDREMLSGWLYTSTRFAASKAVRMERRRRQRERVTATMHEQISFLGPASESDWVDVRPVLDEAMARLGPADRNVVLQRFFEGKELKAIGAALGISEDAARMRVNRALEKLRTCLLRRKVRCTTASLGALLLANAAHAAPAGLAASLATAAIGGAAAAGGIPYALTLLQFMASTKLKVAVATVALAGVTTPLLLQHHALSRLHVENHALRERLTAPQPAPPPREPIPAETTLNDADRAELLRLRGQVATLRKDREDFARAVAALSATTNKTAQAAPPPEGTVDAALVQQVVAGPPSFQGSVAGSIRGKGLREGGRAITATDAAVQHALLDRQLNNTLERSPVDFAEFQTAFIQEAVGITDPAKVEQIRQIIRQTYDEAVARGLDIPSKPSTEIEPWARARWEIDHANTKAVKELLTPEQRKLFGRGFIGIMGVDLGGIGVDKSNYPPGVVGP